MYSIRFRERAKRELADAVEIYGNEFRANCSTWLQDLAKNAQDKDEAGSIDLGSALSEGIEMIEMKGAWKRSFQRFWKAAPLEKLKALEFVLRQREPPWQFRSSAIWFGEILGVISAEIHVYYEVDHVQKSITITMFTGLPGQGD